MVLVACGVLLVRELGSILRVRYENDPGLLAAFQSAARIEHPPRRAKTAGTSGVQAPAVASTAPDAGAGPTSAVLALAAAGRGAEVPDGQAANGAGRNGVMLA